ncbi:GNAT family N-acetyltransferase [uncultured Methanobrevibacter sp.]|uniref:GNAT family N-acetyltransferase n=1 Tax=uncultured Methanobrevibacter sp. TaxID=253161 RepID=UPI0026057063|nr:GNAT family N-acetyltransferase [uncultured Methanobrevibacter sp.]
MEIVVTDERDERFIEFCDSFGCFIDDPQVVLLLVSFGKTVGCTSFKVYDGDSCEITTLFLNSYDEREKIAYKLIRQLEKIAADYEFKSVVVTFESRDDILIEIFEKLDYSLVENADEILYRKEFKSLI